MNTAMRRASVVLLSSAGVLTLFLAVIAPVTPAHANGVCTEDCADAPSEGTAGATPTGDAESDMGSDGTGSGAPGGDSESDTSSEGATAF